MLFNSYIFILLFLPLVLAGFYILNRYKRYRLATSWILVMSLWFYGYFNVVYLSLMISSILVNYTLSILMCGKNPRCLRVGQEEALQDNAKMMNAKSVNMSVIKRLNSRTVLFAIGSIFNLGMLFYFKYYGFFVENINSLFNVNFNVTRVLLPLGISFFTFQQLSFLIDCYRNQHGIRYGFLEYATFVTFFPQLVAGPIVMHSELIPQLRDESKRKIDYNNLSKGLYAFALGLGKKVLIADNLSGIVSAGYGNVEGLNSATALVVMVAYTLQIYFDFSGYCDMAYGMGLMFNITLPFNFNSPYKAKSIGAFWKRWHMTLTRFFTHYVYIPLGGSRIDRFHTVINMLVVFLLSGFWHGANWTFVLWGGMHGIVMVAERLYKDIKADICERCGCIGRKDEANGLISKSVSLISLLLTFLFVNIAWVFFRANSIHDAVIFLKILFGRVTGPIGKNVIDYVSNIIEIRMLGKLGLDAMGVSHIPMLVVIILILISISTMVLSNTQDKVAKVRLNVRTSIVSVILLVWCVLSLSNVSEFLYYNF